ncbi:MAG TPA: DNA-directed RNA polymerase subunit A' [Nanoarchaeota archaeon]|nr:DNA-directed RNA polymerase subunit A' [Nanoarchaeota archaeon]
MHSKSYSYKKVDKIVFGMLSPKMIKKMATAKIVTPELYDREGYPVDGGLMDIRLGVIDPGLRCKTCGEKLKECQGHFGYIEFARPLIHIDYAKVLFNFLQCTCRECGKILMPEEERQKILAKIDKYLQKNNVDSFRKASKLAKIMCRSVRKCPHCKAKQLGIKIEKPTTFFEDTKRLNPIEIRARMEKVSDEDCLLLGLRPEYARPEWMILTVLGIPPVTMRPSITLETGERAEDDLTHKLSDIVRINQRLFENINAGAPEIIIEDLWDLLQYHVTTYFDNEITQVPPARHRSGQPLKTLSERIKSKEGRFRHNLAGKRVNFAARTVISPDPKIGLNEVGIPFEVAMELTVPENVTEWNIEWLKEFLKKGPKQYPGANYVTMEDGKKKKISAETQEQLLQELTPGQVVERHIVDGDVAIFNRQPSLHRMSIMCHKVRVLPGKSFRLNPAVCNPYNADFDGDEMNLHVPQTQEAMAEAETLMEVQTQIMSPKNGLNVIGCIDDAVTGNYLLTKLAEMPKQEAIMLLLSIGVDEPDRFRKFKETVNGKEIFSALLPKDFQFVGFSKNCKKHKVCEGKKCETDSFIVIKDGNLVSGVIDSNTVGEGNGTLLRDIHRLYNETTSVDLFGKIFRLGIAYLLKCGMTIKTSDADMPEDIQGRVKEMLESAETDVDKLIADFKSDKLKAGVSMSIRETLERMILQRLNEARNEIGKLIAKSAAPGNSSLIMAQSGAKGNILNLAQTAALVGQQALRGKRINKGYRNRTLSLFKQFDLSPAAHGFVRHSYKKGLNPYEFFFHAMTGRDSLMDTALRTPKSGYLYRRLANAMQDLKIEYDYTVRDANNAIVQFTYGDDGVDVSKSDGGSIDVKKIINEVEGAD